MHPILTTSNLSLETRKPKGVSTLPKGLQILSNHRHPAKCDDTCEDYLRRTRALYTISALQRQRIMSQKYGVAASERLMAANRGQ